MQTYLLNLIVQKRRSHIYKLNINIFNLKEEIFYFEYLRLISPSFRKPIQKMYVIDTKLYSIYIILKCRERNSQSIHFLIRESGTIFIHLAV